MGHSEGHFCSLGRGGLGRSGDLSAQRADEPRALTEEEDEPSLLNVVLGRLDRDSACRRSAAHLEWLWPTSPLCAALRDGATEGVRDE